MNEILDKRQTDLWEALIKSGIVKSDKKNSARVTVNRWVQKGYFVYPAKKFERRYSQRMIDDIIKAFSPGGSKHWDVNDYK